MRQRIKRRGCTWRRYRISLKDPDDGWQLIDDSTDLSIPMEPGRTEQDT